MVRHASPAAERATRGELRPVPEQIAKRPALRRLLEDVEAGRVQMVMVHTFDRWSRNVLVTLQTFRALAEKRCAKLRKLPCPTGGYRTVRVDLVQRQFGEWLAGLNLTDSWREEVRQRVAKVMEQAGVESVDLARERERLRRKRTRILKQHREGYIDDEEMRAEIAAVELALGRLSLPTPEGLSLDAILEAGERLPGIATLWEIAIPEERCEMVPLLLEAGGLYYGLERKMIAAIKPRLVWLPVLRFVRGVVESQEAPGMLFTAQWQQENQW